MKAKKLSLAMVVIFLAVLGMAASADISFVLGEDKVQTGESVTVTFDKPLPKQGERYWITVIPASKGDAEWGDWKYVDVGVKAVSVTAPAMPEAMRSGSMTATLNSTTM